MQAAMLEALGTAVVVLGKASAENGLGESGAAAAGTASEEDAFREVAASAGIAWKCVSWCGQGVTVLVIEDPPPPAT